MGISVGLRSKVIAQHCVLAWCWCWRGVVLAWCGVGVVWCGVLVWCGAEWCGGDVALCGDVLGIASRV
jgi:hypothetical protein